MIWKLLRKNISVGQIAGYALANFVGLAIVLSAIRFYGDVSQAFDTDDSEKSLIAEDYMVISRPVSMLKTGESAKGFSAEDIEDIKSQPWAVDVGEFSSANFSVGAAIDFGNDNLTTFLFLESIPDAFIDVKSGEWTFDPEHPGEIPIIISKDYLALYNFGFAASRGLPQLSEGLISKVPLTLMVSGNDNSDRFAARIVGFSTRLNTIAVPEAFLQWANARYSDTPARQSSRLIIRVNKPGDPQIAKYIERKGYEVAGDKLDTGKASYFLTLLTTIVIVIGAIISALALFILMLSIFLLLQRNKEKISDLLLLGYSPAQVSASYFKLIGGINAGVLVLALAAMFGVSAFWESRLAQLSLVPSSPVAAIAVGIAIVAIITAINFMAISRTVTKNFRK